MPIVYIIALIIIIIFLFSIFPYRKITVFEYERGLKYNKGKFIEILEPGQYWCSKMSFQSQPGFYNPNYYNRSQNLSEKITIKKVDIRPTSATIPGQEVLSSDSISLKVSIIAKYEITDPYSAVNKSQNFQEALYSEIQLAVREIIGTSKIDELLENRQLLNQKLFEIVLPKIAELGLKLHSVSIKDIMFPGELKQIFAQVVKAQKEGLAILEKSRGETAALRKLVNAAKIIEEYPSLMYLRLIQSLGESKGNTLVFGVSPENSHLFKKNDHPASKTDNGFSKEEMFNQDDND